MSNPIYLDHAATTPICPQVTKAMLPYLTEHFGNPSSIYKIGRDARAAIDAARHTVAQFIGAQDNEIVFTSCGTESDNMAIFGSAYANERKGNHIISTSIEHHAVIETLHFLEKRGFEVTYVNVDKCGQVDPQDIKNAIKDSTILISVMYANNEIGTIEPIDEIAKIADEKGIAFHTDAVQAVASLPINLKDSPINLLAMSAHKFYGPKGVGALYIKKGTKMIPYLHGGAQERRRRAGTENVAAIVGMAKAIEIASKEINQDKAQISALRDKLINGLLENIDESYLNGHPTNRLPNNVNIGFRYIEGESMCLNLDALGIYASTGSACSSATLDASHVLLAIGLEHEQAHGSLRFSLGRSTSEEDINTVIEKLPPIIERLRMMSPLYKKPEIKK